VSAADRVHNLKWSMCFCTSDTVEVVLAHDCSYQPSVETLADELQVSNKVYIFNYLVCLLPGITRLTWVIPDKVQRAVKRTQYVCVCLFVTVLFCALLY